MKHIGLYDLRRACADYNYGGLPYDLEGTAVPPWVSELIKLVDVQQEQIIELRAELDALISRLIG